jgi:uncharacterized damage-inducible protein DinB
MNDARYPIGPHQRQDQLTSDERRDRIAQIAATPANLRTAVRDLDEPQLDTPYRDGGWTLRQVVHHLADSHLNAYTRLKLALTEEQPTIRPFDEAAWAQLPDSRSTPIGISLTLLDALHERWITLWRSMKDDDYERTLNHPENGLMTLDRLLNLYAWHGRHHVAHITSLRERNGW